MSTNEDKTTRRPTRLLWFSKALKENRQPTEIFVAIYIPVRGRRFIQIDTKKPMCDPMCYPLLFPSGDDGWYTRMPYTTTSRMEGDAATAMAMIVGEDEEQQIDSLWPMPMPVIK